MMMFSAAPAWLRATVARTGAGLLAWGVLSLAGCAHRGWATSEKTRVVRFTADLVALGPEVDIDEARALAERAQAAADELREDYRMIWPAWLHNILVNHGKRKRGLCFQWADDMHARLSPLPWRTLELGFAVAREHTDSEHNTVTVRARGRPFEEAIVIDPWRTSGELFWAPVSTDHYPWKPFTRDNPR